MRKKADNPDLWTTMAGQRWAAFSADAHDAAANAKAARAWAEGLNASQAPQKIWREIGKVEGFEHRRKWAERRSEALRSTARAALLCVVDDESLCCQQEDGRPYTRPLPDSLRGDPWSFAGPLAYAVVFRQKRIGRASVVQIASQLKWAANDADEALPMIQARALVLRDWKEDLIEWQLLADEDTAKGPAALRMARLMAAELELQPVFHRIVCEGIDSVEQEIECLRTSYRYLRDVVRHARQSAALLEARTDLPEGVTDEGLYQAIASDLGLDGGAA